PPTPWPVAALIDAPSARMIHLNPRRGRIMMLRVAFFTLVVAALCTAPFGGPAAAQSVADFYRGKTITCFIGYGVGGGYDLFARSISRHMSRHLPGNPTIMAVTCRAPAALFLANI